MASLARQRRRPSRRRAKASPGAIRRRRAPRTRRRRERLEASAGASITFLGAARVVTGSQFLVSAGTVRGLVDCGLFQGTAKDVQRNRAPPAFEPACLDWVILTHAHLDHAGSLPRLVQLGYQGPIYATPATIDLARVLLVDAGWVQEEEAQVAAGQGRHAPGQPPLYTAADARACLGHFRPLEYDHVTAVASGVRVRLRDAGHILGSAIVELWIEPPAGPAVKVVFSGDLGRLQGGLLRPPTFIDEADAVLLDSTYGNRAHPRERPEDALAQALDEALMAGGRLLIPAFAVGRAQDLLFHLRVLQASGRVPPVPVYVDSPLAREATEAFAAHAAYHGPAVRAWLERSTSAREGGPVTFVASRADTFDVVRRDGPVVVIAANGMATAGRVLHYLQAWLPDERSVVLFPGYQAAGTTGRALVEGARTVMILGQVVPVRARIRQSDAFSAHADAPDLLRWLAGFRSQPRRVYLVHGERPAVRALARRIRADLGWQAHAPSYGERVRVEPARPKAAEEPVAGNVPTLSEPAACGPRDAPGAG